MSKPARALADAARREAHPVGRHPLDRRRQIVDPEPDMVERRGVHGGLLVGVQRLHQVDLDRMRPVAHGADVLVDVLALADEVALDRQPEDVDPERLEALLVGPADGDLLQAEDRLNGFRLEAQDRLIDRQAGAPSQARSAVHAARPGGRTTTPSTVATRMFSIFIASMTASRSPACTVCPGLTASVDQQPGHRREQELAHVGRRLERHHGEQLGRARAQQHDVDRAGRCAAPASTGHAVHLGRERLAVAQAGRAHARRSASRCRSRRLAVPA